MGIRDDRIADLTKELRLLEKPLKEGLARQEQVLQELRAGGVQLQAIRVELKALEQAEMRLVDLEEGQHALIEEADRLQEEVVLLQAQKRVAEVQVRALQELEL